MRRWLLPALMITLLLTGCGGSKPERKLEDMRKTLAAAQEVTLTAEVTALLRDEEFSCTLACTAAPECVTVEVLAPETIAGIRATVGADGTRIEYEDVALGLGGWAPDAAPVTALPLLLTALRTGSTLRAWTEWEEERTLFVREYYVTDDTTLCVWFDAKTSLPVHAEFSGSSGGRTLLRCEITDFTYR